MDKSRSNPQRVNLNAKTESAVNLSCKNLARLRRSLLAIHGPIEGWLDEFPLHSLADDPLGLLVGTVLSQATNDRNSSRAYRELRRAFPNWEDVLSASVEEIARVIASGGLGPQKARAIKGILARISRDFGEFSLDPLRRGSPADARRYLVSLPGVGPKTAACVQLFALGQTAFPVDTHIHRIAGRLGLAPPKANPGQVQALLEEAVSRADAHHLHLLLIKHGREFCRPAKPRCAQCALRPECAHAISSSCEPPREE